MTAGMLTLAVAVPQASADPIVITGGSMGFEGRAGLARGTVDVEGTRGLHLQLFLAVDETGPWDCYPCGPPGTSLSLAAFIDTSDGVGTVRLDGTTYPVSVDSSFILLRPAGTVVLPPWSATPVSLSAPFQLEGSRSHLDLFDVGGLPTQTFPLAGRGVATITLTPSVGVSAWEFASISYEFSPIPEPTSLLLLGSGMLALAATRRRPPPSVRRGWVRRRSSRAMR